MRTMADKEKRQPVPAGEIKPVKDSIGEIFEKGSRVKPDELVNLARTSPPPPPPPKKKS